METAKPSRIATALPTSIESARSEQPSPEDASRVLKTDLTLSLTPRKIQTLQRTIGNRATQTLLRQTRIQREFEKLEDQERWTAVSVKLTAATKDKDVMADILPHLKARTEAHLPFLDTLTTVFANIPTIKVVFGEDGNGGHYSRKDKLLEIQKNTSAGMADTLVFEFGNALRAPQGDKNATDFSKGAMSLPAFGTATATNEAGAMLDYLDAMASWLAAGNEADALPAQAKRTHDHFEETYQYFSVVIKDSEEKKKFSAKYTQDFNTSPHEKGAKGRMGLSSQDLYAYEKVVDRAFNGNLTTVHGLVKKLGGTKVNSGPWLKSEMKLSFNRSIAEDPESPRYKAIAKFYVAFLDRVKVKYPDLDFASIDFNEAQRKIADEEAKTSGVDIDSLFIAEVG